MALTSLWRPAWYLRKLRFYKSLFFRIPLFVSHLVVLRKRVACTRCKRRYFTRSRKIGFCSNLSISYVNYYGLGRKFYASNYDTWCSMGHIALNCSRTILFGRLWKYNSTRARVIQYSTPFRDYWHESVFYERIVQKSSLYILHNRKSVQKKNN